MSRSRRFPAVAATGCAPSHPGGHPLCDAQILGVKGNTLRKKLIERGIDLGELEGSSVFHAS